MASIEVVTEPSRPVVTATLPALEELKTRCQWVVFCLEPDEKDTGRLTKVPYNANNGYKASTTNPKNWATYAQAVTAHRNAKNADGKAFDGIGYVFDRDVTGIDFDHCIDENGRIDSWAQAYLDEIDSYAERSPNDGIHAFVHGLVPLNAAGKRKGRKIGLTGKRHPKAAIEMYSEGRFFTITEKHIDGTPTMIEDRQEQLLALHTLLYAPKTQTKKSQPKQVTPLSLSDNDLLDIAHKARNRAKFAALWRGDFSSYLSQSEADQALCNLLAFYTGNDAGRMDHLFKQSGLHRDKWDNHPTYASDTLGNAIDRCTEVYTPARRNGYTDTTTTETPSAAAATDASGAGAIYPPDFVIAQQAQSPLPQIILGEQLRETRQAALKALAAKEKDNPTLFIQTARIKRIGRDERMTPIIIDVGEAELRNALTDSANYFRINAKNELVPVAPPKDVVQSIIGLKTEVLPFPPLEAIVQTPIMRPDGTILATPGYDAPTHLYYMPQEGLSIPAIPQSPTQSQVKEAMKLVQGFLQDFPFETKADAANAIAALQTTVTRQMFRHVPLALIDATKQGTGKGLLTDAIAITATGRSASAISQVNSDEEWDKRITAMLLSGATMIVVDNVEGTLRSPILSKILTSEYHNGRMLGQSKMVDVAQRAIWIANGNNIQLGGDMPRRCYRIRMVSQVSNPFEREGFKYDHLDEAMKTHRGEIIAALLTIARGWYAAGQPAPAKKIKKLATFSKWAEVIGGMLSYAGIDGFLENLDALHKEIDIDGAAWSLFLETWAEKLGTEAYTTKMLLEKIKECEDLADVLPEPLATLYAKDEKTIKNKIGRALSKKNGTPFGTQNLRIVQGEDTHSKVATYKVAGYSNQYPAKSTENQAQNAGYAGYAGMETTYAQDEISKTDTSTQQDIPLVNIHIEYGASETRDTPHTPQSEHKTQETSFNTPQIQTGVPIPPPDKTCMRCGQRAWIYQPDVIGKYVCACMVSEMVSA